MVPGWIIYGSIGSMVAAAWVVNPRFLSHIHNFNPDLANEGVAQKERWCTYRFFQEKEPIKSST